MKKGILGGTFDPIHNGHIYLAENAYREFSLDMVLLMPANVPYFKTALHKVTDASLRLKMTELAVEDIDYMKASSFELGIKGNTYTSDTILRLKKEYPDDEFYFIMGADSLFKLESWRRPDILLKNAVILCAGREQASDEVSLEEEISRLKDKYRALKPDIRPMSCENIDISSTEIRELLNSGGDASGLLPDKVLEFIKKNSLYKTCNIL